MDNSITVITLTRKRIALLKRTITSIQKQTYRKQITHMIVVDDCLATAVFLKKASSNLPPTLLWQLLPRSTEEQSGSQRVAKLRNYAVQFATTPWISFLDDDNEFEPDHLRSLVECATHTGCQAVHSQRSIYWPDGTPYLEPRFPWSRNVEEGKRLYAELCTEGIFQPGSNVMRDKVFPRDYLRPPFSVDTGEWLFTRDLLLQYPFSTEEYTQHDWDGLPGRLPSEDDKLLWILVEKGVPIASTENPTLKYYLGGYSNQLSL